MGLSLGFCFSSLEGSPLPIYRKDDTNRWRFQARLMHEVDLSFPSSKVNHNRSVDFRLELFLLLRQMSVRFSSADIHLCGLALPMRSRFSLQTRR